MRRLCHRRREQSRCRVVPDAAEVSAWRLVEPNITRSVIRTRNRWTARRAHPMAGMAAVSARKGRTGRRRRYSVGGSDAPICEPRHPLEGHLHRPGHDVATAGGGHAVDVPVVLHLDVARRAPGTCGAADCPRPRCGRQQRPVGVDDAGTELPPSRQLVVILTLDCLTASGSPCPAPGCTAASLKIFACSSSSNMPSSQLCSM